MNVSSLICLTISIPFQSPESEDHYEVDTIIVRLLTLTLMMGTFPYKGITMADSMYGATKARTPVHHMLL
jgi:hypothetical protein